MIGYFALIIFFILAFLREARHDAVISRLKQSAKDSLEWHKLDWQYLALIGVGISIFGGDYRFVMNSTELILSIIKSLAIGITVATLKVLIFNVRINKIFGHSWNYLSGTGFESKFKGKENIYYGACLFGFLSAVTYILFYYGIFNNNI